MSNPDFHPVTAFQVVTRIKANRSIPLPEGREIACPKPSFEPTARIKYV
jgi:hypothetical protein